MHARRLGTTATPRGRVYAERAHASHTKTASALHHQLAEFEKLGEPTETDATNEVRGGVGLGFPHLLIAEGARRFGQHLVQYKKRAGVVGHRSMGRVYVDTEGTPYAREFAAVGVGDEVYFARGAAEIGELLKQLQGKQFVCWGAAHDRKALEPWREADREWMDAMVAYRRRYPEERYWKFEKVYRKFIDKDYKQKHNALDDARDLRKLVETLKLNPLPIKRWEPGENWEVMGGAASARRGWRESAPEFKGFSVYVRGVDDVWRRVGRRKVELLSDLLEAEETGESTKAVVDFFRRDIAIGGIDGEVRRDPHVLGLLGDVGGQKRAVEQVGQR